MASPQQEEVDVSCNNLKEQQERIVAPEIERRRQFKKYLGHRISGP